MTENQDSPATPESGGQRTPAASATASQAVHPAAAEPPKYDTEPPSSIPRRVFFRLFTLSWVHFIVIVGVFGAWFSRFLFPNVRFEPPTRIRIGKPEDYLPGVVDTRFKKRHGIWIVRTENRIFALSTTCTHLGCTPNWLPTEEKFKCPCHGSGFSPEGVNFEGPAPRPLERYQISLDDAGGIVVDKSAVFRQEKDEWDLPHSYIPV